MASSPCPLVLCFSLRHTRLSHPFIHTQAYLVLELHSFRRHTHHESRNPEYRRYILEVSARLSALVSVKYLLPRKPRMHRNCIFWSGKYIFFLKPKPPTIELSLPISQSWRLCIAKLIAKENTGFLTIKSFPWPPTICVWACVRI